MKYRTFITLRNTAAVGLVGLGVFGLVRGCAGGGENVVASGPQGGVAFDDTPRRPSASSRPSNSPTTRRAFSPSPSASLTPEREPVVDLHRDILRRVKEPVTNGTASGSGRKWRIKEGRRVVELRCDTDKGFTTWNRVKLDLDGDKQWDEAWDIRPNGDVKRRVAANDDENYATTYDLQGNQWVRRSK